MTIIKLFSATRHARSENLPLGKACNVLHRSPSLGLNNCFSILSFFQFLHRSFVSLCSELGTACHRKSAFSALYARPKCLPSFLSDCKISLVGLISTKSPG